MVEVVNGILVGCTLAFYISVAVIMLRLALVRNWAEYWSKFDTPNEATLKKLSELEQELATYDRPKI